MINKNKQDIWKNVLLKQVKGSAFCNATTIRDAEKTYQVFEVLVVETLACIQPEMEWQVTAVKSDNGVDLIAVSDNKYYNPFSHKTVESVILGQIKRRSNDYRNDDFRNDIISIIEYYKSCYVSAGKSLLEILFVVSTDKGNNLKNLEKNLIKSQKEKSPMLFAASVSSPIHIIDAKEVILYWKYNFSFVSGLISNFVSEKNIAYLKSYLNKITDSYLQISVNKMDSVCIGDMATVNICITTIPVEIPLQLQVTWTPSMNAYGIVQLIAPIELVAKEKGVSIATTNEYNLSISFRALREGDWGLGSISILAGDTHLVEHFPIGDIHFIRSINPVYQINPNHDIYQELHSSLVDKSSKYNCSIVTGSGGIGKSSLIRDLMIPLSNQGYMCINQEHKAGYTENVDFLRDLICKILSLQLHKPCYFDKIHEVLILFLKDYYLDEWQKDLYAFFQDDQSYNNNIISDVLSAIIMRVSLKQPLVIWLSNLHWLTEQEMSILTTTVHTIENNRRFLPFSVQLILEGRKDEALIENNRVIFPKIWENFQQKINARKYRLKLWKPEDISDFIKSLLNLPCHDIDYSLYLKLAEDLEKNCTGIPMHVTEQIHYLLSRDKLALDEAGQLSIINSDWEGMFSDNLKELIHNRLIYFMKTNPEYGSWLILYAKFDSKCSKTVKKEIFNNIKKSFVLADKIALESDFFRLSDNDSIEFQHECYVEQLKNMPVPSKTVIGNFQKWMSSQQYLPVGDMLCRIILEQLLDAPDYRLIVNESQKILSNSRNDAVLLSLYSILTSIPEHYLEEAHLYHYLIHYHLSSLLMRLGNYETAKDQLENSLKKSYANADYAYYRALSYQQLSNIESVKFHLDSAIDYAQKGISLLQIQKKEFPLDLQLDDVEAMLLSRQSINYAFAGDWNAAMRYQKKSVCHMLKNQNKYIAVRIGYERCGLMLHKSLRTNIRRLNFLYGHAQKMDDMYPTELYFIKVMELVGRIILFQKETTQIHLIQNESRQLEALLTDKKSNYIECLNYLVLGSCSLLLENTIHHALQYFFKALECGLDSYREEMLWKCYINIAQLYYFSDEYKKALHYAKKSKKILTDIIQNNPRQCDELKIKYKKPIHILNLIKENTLYLIDPITEPFHILEPLSITYMNQIIFIMK